MTWCRDPARDEAVRAAEDNRDRPLPTLEEAIAAPFACAVCKGEVYDHRFKESCPRCGGDAETWLGHKVLSAIAIDGFRKVEEAWSMIPKTSSPTSAPEQENKGDGMRTERITLEVTHGECYCLPEWSWATILRLHPGESVRVVDAHAERVAESVAWEGARDAYRGRILRLTEERDAAIRERNKLRARVAELESRNVTPGEDSCAAPAASGGGAEQCVTPGSCGATTGDSCQDWQLTSSGGGKPVAWMCEWTDHTSLYLSKIYAESDAADDVVPQPLYLAPPQPRGWLTGEERKWIEYMKGNCVLPYAGMACMEAILARSTPPEVVLRSWTETNHANRVMSAEEVIAAIAAAGVAVKEVGRE